MHQDQPIASEPVEKLLGEIDPVVSRILEGALAGNEITGEEALALFQTRERELEALLLTADALRRATVGDRISFVVTRNINFTNICYTGCRFLRFRQTPR